MWLSFVTVKTFDVIMHMVNTNFMADVIENIGLKLHFQSSFSIRLVLHKLGRWIIISTKKIIESLLNLLFRISMNLI